MYTLGAGRILIKSIINVCLLNLLAWKASWAHRTGENGKKDNDEIKISQSKRRAPVFWSVANNKGAADLHFCLSQMRNTVFFSPDAVN